MQLKFLPKFSLFNSSVAAISNWVPFLWPWHMQACLCPNHTAYGCCCFKDHFPSLSLWTCHSSLGIPALPPPSPISHQHKLPIFIFKAPWDPTYHLSLSGGRNREQSSSNNSPAWADFQLCCAWSLYAFLEQDVGEQDWPGAKKRGSLLKAVRNAGSCDI